MSSGKKMPFSFIFNDCSLKRSSTIFTVMAAALLMTLQVSGQVTAVFGDDRNFLVIENEHYRTVFVLEADKEKYNQFVAIAATMPETFSTTIKKIKKNRYQCSILFTHPTDPSYVKKILTSLGIEQLRVNNKLFELSEFEPVFE